MNVALQVAPPDLVIFFTDGNPTVYSDSMGNFVSCPGEVALHRPDIVNPMLLANYFKDSIGAHIFALGVGDVTEENLQNISGNTEFDIDSNSISNSDFFVSESFESLATDLRNFALQLCGADLNLGLAVAADTLCTNEDPEFKLTIVNDNLENKAVGVVIRDTFPASLQNVQCITNCLLLTIQ